MDDSITQLTLIGSDQPVEQKKKCIGCNKRKKLREFAGDKSRPDEHEYYCKQCRREQQPAKHIKTLIHRGEKQCIGCRKVKKIGEFFENHQTRDKIDLYCIECRQTPKTKTETDTTREKSEFRISGRTARRIRSYYKINENEYRNLYEQQKGLCAICGRPELKRRNTMLCVDHDHTTGKVRGLLCGTCNSAIGYFEDNPDYLRSAISYLEQHS